MPVANTEEEWTAMLADRSMEIVRDHISLAKALAEDEAICRKSSTANLLSFIGTVEFNELGFRHADYSAVADELDEDDLARIWALFGLSRSLSQDYQGHKCDGQHTCWEAMKAICTSNCAHVY